MLLLSALTAVARVDVADCVAKEPKIPVAVLLKPVVLLRSALKPTAVLLSPVVLFKSASSPKTVFSFVKQPCWQVARACGKSAKQASTSGMTSKTSGQDERFIGLFDATVVVFICARFCVFFSPHGNDKVISQNKCGVRQSPDAALIGK